jgi:hypothetical protein
VRAILGIPTPRTMDTLHLLRRSDLRKLMVAAPAELPGRILCLNRLPRYHNQLDAIAISVEVLQRRSIGSTNGPQLFHIR